MKSIRFFYSLSCALAASLMAVSAFSQTANQVFTIKGNIPGIKNGTKVSLKSQENGKDIQAECMSQGSSFLLTGKVSGTIWVQLKIDDKPQNEYHQDEFSRDRGGDFMLEAADYTVSATCFDSIPLNYDYRNVTMVREKNLKIVGGKAQQQYQEWADATYDARLKAKLLDKQYRDAQFREKGQGGPDSVSMLRLQPLVEEANAAEEKLTNEFIAAHPNYSVSLLLQESQLEKPFAFTAEQYDKLLSKFANNDDQIRYDHFVKKVEEMKAYVKGLPYKDLLLETTDGQPVHLKNVVIPGKYNFIDFWASWCGPCRAAIPSVKQLQQKLGDKLNIISISVDKKRQDWERAMEVEKMTWGQYLVPLSSMKALKDNYYVKFIPSLVVVDPEGNIQLYTSNPDKAHSYLEEKVK
nr:TlpA disulfide reductase family protein [Prevotella sp.]